RAVDVVAAADQLPAAEAVAVCLAWELNGRPLPVTEPSPEEWEPRVTQIALANMHLEPRCQGAATRGVLRGLYRELLGTPEPDDERYRQGFVRYIRVGVERGRLDPRLLQWDLPRLAAALAPEGDRQLPFVGLTTLIDRYLVRDV